MKPLNVVLPCWKGDQDQAERLLLWIGEMGMVQAPFWLLCDDQCNHRLLLDLASKCFTKVGLIQDRERIESNWGEVGDHPKSAAGPNSLFRQAAWYFMMNKLGPWFWCEPDAIWCRRDTYQMIEREYQLGNQAFMGYLVSPQNHPGVPNHMSGVGVYPENTPSVAPKASNAGEVAFDIAGVDETCGSHTYFTKIIHHHYRAPGFTSEEEFNQRVPEHLALFHANKDGSILPFLRKRLGIQQSVASVSVSGLTVTQEEPITEPCKLTRKSSDWSAGSNPATCDIFIKTREHDYPWLEWCHRSIGQFAKGFRHLVVSDDYPNLNSPVLSGVNPCQKQVVPVPREPGYLWQQVCKLYADDWTDADYILFMDSDCVFTRPVTPADFIKDGKVIWQYTPRDQSRSDQHVWYPVMEKFLGKKPEQEFMRRHPFCVQRWMLEEFRTFCKYRHGKSLEDYILGEADPLNPLALSFSEWNCLGFFLWEHHRDKVEWVLDHDAGPACVYQGFTHGGEERKREDIATFKELLGSPSGDAGSSTPDVQAPSLTISSAIAFLASQATSNPIKGQIVRDLKKAWKGTNTRIAGGGRKKAPPGMRINPEWEKADLELGSESFHPDVFVKSSTLLCIHSYPGANETVKRHWNNFNASGATRIAGIGTTDGKCTWPDGLDYVIDIGENSYMKLKGKDDHLCRRLIDTFQWCMTTDHTHFIVAEYDVLFLRKLPSFKGVSACLTGGRVNGSKTNQYFHGPWLADRESAPALIAALEAVLPDSQEYPNNSPDLFFGLACERAGIQVNCNFKMFTRNTLDHDLDKACEAARDGAHVIHGVKTKEQFEAIMNALNPELSVA